MNKRKHIIWRLIGGVAILTLGFVAYALLWTSQITNDLGLTRSDLAIGEHPNVDELRAKTMAVADAYLAQRTPELTEVCGGPYELTVDSALSSKIRSLGYRSSFYYYCWDIYRPYSLQCKSGNRYIVVAQLSDKTPGNTHHPDKFRVIRAMVIDDHDKVVRTLKE